MRFGFFGMRGLNEIVDENLEGFYFQLKHDGEWYDKFFFNIGQPDQDPMYSLNPLHKDDLSYNSHVRIEYANFKPFYAKYQLYDNSIELVATDEVVFCKFDLVDEVRVYNLGDTLKKIFPTISEKDISGIHVLYYSPIGTQVENTAKSFEELKAKLPQHVFNHTPKEVAKYSVFYNIMLSHELEHRYYVPVNRVWMPFIANLFLIPEAGNGPMIVSWDHFFASLILAYHDMELAKLNYLSTLDIMQPNGRQVQGKIKDHVTDKSNPPVWFLVAKLMFDIDQDLEFLKVIYERLDLNFQWWLDHRYRVDKTFSWGLEEDDGFSTLRNELNQATPKLSAMHESGCDDSPVFYGMEFDDELRMLDHSCVDLSSLMCLNANIMAELSGLLGKEAEQTKYKLQASQLAQALARFFNKEQRTANSYKVMDGKKVFNQEITPLSLYLLLSKDLTTSQLDLLAELYEHHFTTPYLLPSVSKHSKFYRGDGDYWRGRIWPPMNYLVMYGASQHLEHEGIAKMYREVKESSEKILMQEFGQHSHIHENYSCETGMGEPRPGTYARSCPMYNWGGLLGILP